MHRSNLEVWACVILLVVKFSTTIAVQGMHTPWGNIVHLELSVQQIRIRFCIFHVSCAIIDTLYGNIDNRDDGSESVCSPTMHRSTTHEFIFDNT